MSRPSYLILHGYEGSGPGHWQTWLAGRLRSTDAAVHYPDLPDADNPRVAPWLDRLAGELDFIGEPPIVICHSLACLLWMHHVGAGGRPAARVLLVAPPSAAGVPEELQSFFPVPPADLDARLVCSDNDPYCPEGAVNEYGKPLGLATDLLEGQGHVNPDAGYGPWPAVEAWARDGAVPLSPR